MLRRHITCQFDRRRASSAINAGAARPRGLTYGSARWLTSRAASHVAASGLRLSEEWECTRYGPDMCQHRTPAWPRLRLGIFFALGSRDPTMSGPDPPEGSGIRPRGPVCTCGGLEPRPEVRAVHPKVRHFPVGVWIYCRHLGVYRLH
jgi:hypothetical protein